MAEMVRRSMIVMRRGRRRGRVLFFLRNNENEPSPPVMRTMVGTAFKMAFILMGSYTKTIS